MKSKVRDCRNGRGDTQTDSYLTPPKLVRDLGEFDLDPCCPYGMPWRTAKYMVRQEDALEDGLEIPWVGRVWCNPPYSFVDEFADKFIEHANGILLVPAKSTDTKWGQKVLKASGLVLFLAGRLLFHKADGTPTDGKWMPSMLLAMGLNNHVMLARPEFRREWPGILMSRCG